MNNGRAVTAICFAAVVGALGAPAAAAGSDRVVVFTPQAVNIDPGVALAVAITLRAEIEARGFEILEVPAGSLIPGVSTDAGADPVEGEAPEQSITHDPGEAASHWMSLSPEKREELAAQLACTYFFDGVLVRLGSQMQLQVKMYDARGALVAQENMKARSEDDLVIVIPQIVDALLPAAPQAPPADESAEFYPQEIPSQRMESNFGIIFGQAFGVSPDLDSYMLISFDGRFELNDFIAEINAGFGLANRDFAAGAGFHMIVNLIGSYYLLPTMVAPYLGGGIGMFVGPRLDDVCDAEQFDALDECDEAIIGWDVFPLVGLELMRHRRMRLHLDFRYSFNWAGDAWGHGPVALLGINF